MRIQLIIIGSILMIQVSLFAQRNPKSFPSPEINDFLPTLNFLSSKWMEGREIGTNGGLMAADYMASMMEFIGLAPYGDQVKSIEKGTKVQSYFQDVDVLKYKTEKSSLTILNLSDLSKTQVELIQGTDYELKAVSKSINIEAKIVFAGYGLFSANNGYDDYKGLDVLGRIVVVLNGFPGYTDTISSGWKLFSKAFGEDGVSIETKLQTAKNHGAIALLVIDSRSTVAGKLSYQDSVANSDKNTEPEYEDADYISPGETEETPCFSLNSSAGKLLLEGTNLSLVDYEKRSAQLKKPTSLSLINKIIRFSITAKAETIKTRNILGIIQGKDSSKNIIIGAHYDHLGKRNNLIYNGSDDNASGSSGLLALAKTWVESDLQPACNIIFASWTAEEKGLLGSQFFVQQLTNPMHDIILYINMDMISRSVIEDTAQRQLSIGTRTSDESIREMARECNATLTHPFELDLWDVTGHSGSDYASFTKKNIPIMTYNTGLHNDYHTPRDISANADLVKMGDVLKVVNDCLTIFIEKSNGK